MNTRSHDAFTANRKISGQGFSDTAEPARISATPHKPDGLLIDEASNIPAPLPPNTRCLVVWGKRRSFAEASKGLAEATGMRLRVVALPEPPIFGPRDVLLIEADSVSHLMDLVSSGKLSVVPRDPAIVVGYPGGADPWQAASHLQSIWPQPDVVMFPQGKGWLADHLSENNRKMTGHPCIGVIGASGGIGTSSVALWLAARMKEDGVPTAVVDAVTGSSGLDSCIAPAATKGLRWEQLESLPRLPEPGQLVTSLPAPHGLPILTGDPASLDQEQPSRKGTRAWEVVDTLAREATVIADLGCVAGLESAVGQGQSWVQRCSALVLLVPFTVRGICQARAAYREWASALPLIAIGVGPRICDVSVSEVGVAVGVPLAGVIPHIPAVYDAYDSGYLLEVGHKKAVRIPIAELSRVVRGLGEEHPAQSRREASALVEKRGSHPIRSSRRSGRAVAGQFISRRPTAGVSS